jgi:hypothetical protein
MSSLTLTCGCYEDMYPEFEWDNFSDNTTQPPLAVNLWQLCLHHHHPIPMYFCPISDVLIALVDWQLVLWQNMFAVDKRHPRITRESKTVAVMIDLYCRNQHGSDRPCTECSDLLVYANERLEGCPFQEGKTTCAKCPVHCFKPAMRDRIKTVMRYSGPRVLLRHPILAIRHFIDRSRKEPIRPHKRRADCSSE